MNTSLRFRLLIGLAVLSVCGLAVGQDVDPPSRVARIQFESGQVSIQPGGVDDWIPVSINRPLTTADRIWTDVESRAELTTGTEAFRLGSETSLTLTNLSDSMAQMELDQGTMSLSVRYLNPGETVEVDMPNLAFTVVQPGEYLFKVMPDADQSWVLVRRGEGEANGADGALDLQSGIWFQFSQGQSLQYTTAEVPARDEFEQWCLNREMLLTGSPSARYVPAGTVGYEALDGNGYWQPSPVYGAVWYPNVHPGWAPYHEGHWAWVEPWGWTWVDDAPWGFAPFHYGRWVNDGGRWGWVPGPVGTRPVYAPALVAWVGGGSIGVGGVGVAWIPLGWHDPYIPTYHVSAAYAMNVNISNSRVVNTVVINNYYSTTDVQVRNTIIVNNIHYENVRVAGAVTGVPANAFASGRPVAQAAVVVPAGAMGRASFVATAAVVPTKEAVLGGHVAAVAPAHLAAPRQVIARTAPPPRPVSFEQQKPLLEKSGGMPLTPQTRATLRASAPPPSGGAALRPAVVVPAKAAMTPARPAPARPAAVAPPAKPITPVTPPAKTVVPPPVPPTKTVAPPPPAPKAVEPPAPAAKTAAPPARNVVPPPPAKTPVPAIAPSRPATPPPAAGRPTPPAAKKTPTPAKNKEEKDKERER
jgi:hypothetical protein